MRALPTSWCADPREYRGVIGSKNTLPAVLQGTHENSSSEDVNLFLLPSANVISKSPYLILCLTGIKILWLSITGIENIGLDENVF